MSVNPDDSANSEIKVAHFASSLTGGANIAGKRLHQALSRRGVKSVFYHGEGSSSDPTYQKCHTQDGFLARNHAALKTATWARKWVEGGFVVGNRWTRPTLLPEGCRDSEVICLHWVARWLDLPSFFSSLPDDIPVVWTLHDFIPVTGGCANPYGCERYKEHCGFCPQLRNPRKRDISYRFHKEKRRLFTHNNIHLVANSSWTAQKAADSTIGKLASSISTIHYGLDLSDYKAIDKGTARRSLSLPESGKVVIGFSCLDFEDERKGAGKLVSALSSFPKEVRQRILLLVLGGGTWPRIDVDFDIVALGASSDSRIQSIFYSCLDFFVLASSSETFGNVVIEAMACKTAVVAFNCGGPGDTVIDGETGLLVPTSGGHRELGKSIRWMVEHPRECRMMGEKAHEDARARFSSELMSDRYESLFSRICGRAKS